MVNWWFGLVVWITGIPCERDCSSLAIYLGAPLESQTTGHQTVNEALVEKFRHKIIIFLPKAGSEQA